MGILLATILVILAIVLNIDKSIMIIALAAMIYWEVASLRSTLENALDEEEQNDENI